MDRADAARLVVGGVVLVVWATGYVLSYLEPATYKAPGEITPIMLGVLAFLSAERIKAALRDKPEKESDDARRSEPL